MSSRDRPLDAAYRRALQEHGYAPDAAQLAAVERLDELHLRLLTPTRRAPGLLQRLGLRAPAAEPAPRGVYLWGGVGRGKTFLMDLFHAHAGRLSRREHFHRFMKDVHERLRQVHDVEDPLAEVARAIARECRVQCLDELQVTDIGDAMILSGLFCALVGNGVTLVFTSNARPGDLYRDGLQRQRFLPAIALIERHTEVLNVDGGVDYRLRQLESAPLYLDSAAADADEGLARRFEAIAGERGVEGGSVEVEGRAIAARRRGDEVVWFAFDAICGAGRSAADYIEVARDHHAVVISGLPSFDATRDDEARRFIGLVDEFYDRNVKLIVSAAAPPDRLYQAERLRFDFARTTSRLIEMQSHDYLARAHRP